MKKVENRIFENELKYNGVTVLKYHIEYPYIACNCNNIGVQRFNNYYLSKAIELKKESETTYYKEAVELYKQNVSNGYPVMVYEIYQAFQVTFNRENIISLYTDNYFFSGGAHGNTIRTSETWNMMNGKIFELYDFFKNNPYFLLDIFKNIITQIETNPENYFEDYAKLMIQTFNPKSFFLIEENIMIYFGQYDIAPYSTGIPVFLAIQR